MTRTFKEQGLPVLILALFVTLFNVRVALAAPSASLITANSTVKVGNELTLEVQVQGVDRILGLDVTVAFDPQKLQVINKEFSEALRDKAIRLPDSNSPSYSPGEVGLGPELFDLHEGVPLPAPGTVARFTFRVLQAGQTNLELTKMNVAQPTQPIPEELFLGGAQLSLTIQESGSGSGAGGGDGSGTGQGAAVSGGASGTNGAQTGLDNGTSSRVAAQPSGTPTAEPGSSLSSTPARPRGWAPGDMPGHWARDTVQLLVDRGIVSGYPDDTFRPEQNITRAEFIAIVVRALGAENGDAASSGDLSFSDGSSIPAWARGVVVSAYARGLIQGDDQGRFRPGDPITRAEIAAIVIRALGKEREAAVDVAGETAFADAGQALWAVEYLKLGRRLALLSGYEDGTFRPLNLSTRAEAAAVVARLLNRLPGSEGNVAD